jgi:hypothetical protein
VFTEFIPGSVSITFHFDLTIASSATLAPATRGTAYSQQLYASGGTVPYKWKKTSLLPKGLKLTSGGLVTGTPSARLAPGTYQFTALVTDRSSPTKQTQSELFSLTIS